MNYIKRVWDRSKKELNYTHISPVRIVDTVLETSKLNISIERKSIGVDHCVQHDPQACWRFIH